MTVEMTANSNGVVRSGSLGGEFYDFACKVCTAQLYVVLMTDKHAYSMYMHSVQWYVLMCLLYTVQVVLKLHSPVLPACWLL